MTDAPAQLSGWTQESDLPGFAREGTSSFVIGDTAYVCGGSDPVLPQMTNQLEAYDPATGLWTARTPHPRQEVFMAPSFVLNGKGYVVGGQLTGALNELYSYDPVSDAWTPHADFTLSQPYGGWGFAQNGKGYIVGTQGSNETWEYDPVSNSWAQRAMVPTTSTTWSGFMINDTAYVIQGSGQMYAYDPLLDAWNVRAPCPVQASLRFAFELGGMGYVTGGAVLPNPPTDEVYRYDPVLGQWFTDLAFAGLPRGAGTSFTVGGKGFVCGGSEWSTVYTLYDDVWSATPLSTGEVEGDPAEVEGPLVHITGQELIIDQRDAEVRGFRIVNALGAVLYQGRMLTGRMVIPIGSFVSGHYAVMLEGSGSAVRFVKE